MLLKCKTISMHFQYQGELRLFKAMKGSKMIIVWTMFTINDFECFSATWNSLELISCQS